VVLWMLNCEEMLKDSAVVASKNRKKQFFIMLVEFFDERL
jgi:hypothetical protein